MERKFKENFSNIDEELVWAFIVEGGMNPWALRELVNDRNLEREMMHNRTRERT